MKKIFRINLFALSMIAGLSSAHSQQLPSQRSFTSVMNIVNQQKALRDKMMQQVKQATPSNASSQIANIQIQPKASIPTQQLAPQQRSQSAQNTNQQPVINKHGNQQQPQIKKE
jgi:hypothetical protein